MAVGAGCLFAVNLKLFADRKLFKIVHALFDSRNVGGRGLGGIVKQAFSNPYRAFDGVGVGPVRAGKLNRGMAQYPARPVRALERDPLETLGLRTFQSVVLGQGGVEHGEVGIDELESGRLAAQDFPEERTCFPQHVGFEGAIEFLVVSGVDGDPVDFLPIEIRIVPGSLRLLVLQNIDE